MSDLHVNVNNETTIGNTKVIPRSISHKINFGTRLCEINVNRTYSNSLNVGTLVPNERVQLAVLAVLPASTGTECRLLIEHYFALSRGGHELAWNAHDHPPAYVNCKNAGPLKK